MKKNVVAGLGEIGLPLLCLISKKMPAIGYDVNPKLVNKRLLTKYDKYDTVFLHVCIPFKKNFIDTIKSLYKKFTPECIVIHSTLSPNTTKKIQSVLPIPII